MADAGGGKRALKPVPATIANPGQHVRDRSAEFDALKLLVTSLRESVFADDDAGIIPEIETQDAEIAKLNAQIENLPALRAPSDKLGAVVRTLGGTATVDSDVAGSVYQLMMENGAYKFALDANVIEIERLKAAMKPNVDGTKIGLEIRVTEYIRQIAELVRLQTVAETHSETVKLENEILKKYMSDLQQAIGEMSFVLDKNIYNENITDEEMKILRPEASADDPLTRAGKAFVLEHIEKFEEALRELSESARS
jgi:hypothetical protein